MKHAHVLSLAALLVTAPLTMSGDAAIESNEACAAGESCCAEAGSTCVINGKPTRDAYYSTKGCIVQT